MNTPVEVALIFTAQPPPPEPESARPAPPPQQPAPAPPPTSSPRPEPPRAAQPPQAPKLRAPRPPVRVVELDPLRAPPAATVDADPAPTEQKTPPGPREAAPRQALKLAPALDLTSQVVSGGEIAVRLDPPAKGLHAVEAPEDLVGMITHETLGAIKVKNGLIHPYYSQLGKALLKRWDAERAVSSKGLSGYIEQRVENSRAYQKIWLNHAAEYGRGGNPLGESAQNVRVAVNTPPSIHSSFAARQALRKQLRQEFRASKKATLRVTQDSTGKLISAVLISPSNDAQVDEAALEDVRAAALQLPPPPPEALGTRRELVSLWQFELIVSITPPVPSITFEFDEALGYIDPRLPLDRRIYKKVKLLSIE